MVCKLCVFCMLCTCARTPTLPHRSPCPATAPCCPLLHARARADAAAVMRVVAVSEPVACGDHDVVLVAVEEWENLAAQPQPLYTGRLRELGYMQ